MSKPNHWVRHVGTRLGLGGNNRVAAFIAVAGVACAVAVVLLTVAVSLGFKRGIRSKLEGITPTVTVQAPYSYVTGAQEQYLGVNPQLKATITQQLGQDAVIIPVMRVAGVLKTDIDFAALSFTGYESQYRNRFLEDCLLQGSLPTRDGEIALSRSVANRLGIKANDRITASFFVDNAIRARRFTVSGIYATNFGDYDDNVCYATLTDLHSITDTPQDTVTQLDVRSASTGIDGAAEAAARLQQALVNRAAERGQSSVPVIDNISSSGSMYLNWLTLLDTNVLVIFGIMCCVAACTLVSSLFILILNNISTIGVLRTLGASGSNVRGVFVTAAMRLVAAGIAIGSVAALTLIAVQWKWEVIPLNPEMYYLTAVPVHITWLHVLAVDAAALVFAWLVLYVPARLASSINPASTVRYE